jgi:hypothetical protein
VSRAGWRLRTCTLSALSNLPVFAVIITLELAVLVLGFRHLRQSRLPA